MLLFWLHLMVPFIAFGQFLLLVMTCLLEVYRTTIKKQR
jgi:hypothetical protein